MADPFSQEVEAITSNQPGSDYDPIEVEKPKETNELDRSQAIEQYATQDATSRLIASVNRKPDTPQENADANAFSVKYDTDPETASRLLRLYGEQDAEIVHKAPEMARKNRALVNWGSQPEKYDFFKSNLHAIEKAQEYRPWEKTPTFLQDIGEALRRNMPTLENVFAIGRYSIGAMSKEELAETLHNIKERRDNVTPYGTNTEGLDKALQEFGLEMDKNIKSGKDIYALNNEDWDDYIRTLVKAADLAGATGVDIANLAWSAFIKNPAATGLKSTESIGSFLGPTIGRVGGGLAGAAIGKLGGPIGAVSGGISGSILGSSFIRYAEEVNEQLSQYTDAQGNVDYLSALNDPETMSRIKTIASTYGVVGGVLDTALGGLGAKIPVKGLKGKVLEIAAEGASEGIAEAGATTAKGVAEGKDTIEAVGEGIREGVIESILVTPTSGTLSFLPGMPSLLGNQILKAKRAMNRKAHAGAVKEKITKIREVVKEGVQTPEDAGNFREVFETLARQEEVVKEEERVDSLTGSEIPQILQPPETTPDTDREVQEEEDTRDVIFVEGRKLQQAFNELQEAGKNEGMGWMEFLTKFDKLSHAGIQLSIDENTPFEIPVEDWAIATANVPLLDQVMDIYTPWGVEPGVETNENILKQEEEQKKVKEEVKKQTKELKSKEVKKIGRFKSVEDKQLYGKLQKQMTERLTKRGDIPPQAVSAFTDIFYQMLQNRAEILQKPLAEVMDSYYISTGKEINKAIKRDFRSRPLGYYVQNASNDKSLIFYDGSLIGSEYLTTLVHEVGHALLYNMMMDWDFIMSKDEKSLTPQQQEYRDTMLATAKALDTPKLQTAHSHELQEQFAQTIEKFFVEGKFTEGPKGEFLLKFQQMLQHTMFTSGLAQAGTNYNHQDIFALPIDKLDYNDVNMIFNSLMGAGQTLKEEVYPLIPEPLLTEEEMGKEEYERWLSKYKAALWGGFTKVYLELFEDNRKYYKTAFPKVYNEVRERLNELHLGDLSQMIKDGFIKIQQKDLRESLGASPTYIKNISKVIPIVKNKSQATVTIKYLRQSGYLDAMEGGEGRALEQLVYATNLDKAAEIETMRELERRKGELPRKDLMKIVSAVLGDEEINKVRLEANRIIKKKYLEQMDVAKAKETFLPTLSRKAINKAAKDRLFNERWGIPFSTYTFLQQQNDMFVTGEGGMSLYLFQGQEFKKRKRKNIYNLAVFKGVYTAEKRLKEALDSGDVPTIVDAITQHEIAVKAEEHKKKLSERVEKIQNSWDKFMRNLTKPVYIKSEDRSGSLTVLRDSIQPTINKIPPDAIVMVDPNLHKRAEYLTLSAAEGTNILSKVNYRWLNEEATFKAQFLQKFWSKGPVTSEANTEAKMTEKDLDAIADTPEVNYNRITNDNEVHLPPEPQDTPKGSKLSWDDSKAILEGNIAGEVKKFEKQRKIPESVLGRYWYFNSVSMKNFITSLVPEKDVGKSWIVKIFQKVSQAEARKNVEHNRIFTKITKAVDKYAKSRKGTDVFKSNDKGGWFSRVFNMTTNKEGGIAAPELGENVQFANIGQIITALLYAGSDSGKNKLLQGGFITKEGKATGAFGEIMNGAVDSKGWDAFVQRLVNEGVLTKEAFDMVQEIHDAFTEIFPLVKQSFIDVEGTEINFVDGREYSIKFPDGTKQKYRGGYYPLVSDKTLTGELENVGANTYKDDVRIAYDVLDSSMGKSRTGAYYPLDLNITLMSFILNKHLIHAYLKRPLTLVENLRRMPKVVEALENRQPGFIKNMLRPWLIRVGQQRYAVQGGSELLNTSALYIRRTTGIGMFFLNIASMAKQLLGVVQAFPVLGQHVGRGRTLKHFIKVSTGTTVGTYSSLKKDIGDKSVFMRDRMDNNQRNLVRGWDEMELRESPRQKVLRLAESGAYMGLQFFQNHVDMAIWLAAVERSKKDGLSDQDSYDYADNLVERTQYSGNISARTETQHGTHWERLAMMISMVAFGMRGQLYEQAARAEAEGENVTLARVNAVIWLSIIPTLLTYAASKALDEISGEEDDDDENKEEIQYLLSQMAIEVGDAYAPVLARLILPFVSGALEGVGVDHPKRQSLFGMGPVESPVKQTVNAARAIGRSSLYQVPLSHSEIKSILTGVTLGTGLPLTPINRYIIPYIEKNQTPGAKRRFSRKRGRALKKMREGK